MADLPRHQLVECKTVDGTSIAGLLYTVDGPAPAIIMSHGFNCVKEMTLPEVAEGFQSLGYNVLLYDARSVGASGGSPRNLLDPLRFGEDLSDIYTYVAGLPSVDARRIVLWGMSFGAMVTICCAVTDHRPKALVLVCPQYNWVASTRADKAYAQLMRDRVSQLRGNEPFPLAPFTAKGDNPIGMPGGMEAYGLMRTAVERGHPGFRDRICLQTYQKLAMFRPMEYMEMLRAPVMMIIPELDDISPPEMQVEAFAKIKAPKREYWAKGKGHLTVATGEGSKEMVVATEAFLRDALNGGAGIS